ncbi:MAG: hypothetical protein RQ739_07770 [Desulfotignum sp.]|nr:hypothetical protein [Desulfotignum sp.]
MKQGTKWQLTAATLGKEFWDRAERLTALRRVEQKEMQDYVSLPFGSHMAFLVRALDGDPEKIDPPSLPPLPTTVDPSLVIEAVSFLRRSSLDIDPRRQWPAGGMPRYQTRGKIPGHLQMQPGKVLCVWGDAGWGTLVRNGKYHENHFSVELVNACIDMIRDWNPEPEPFWVTCVPSLRHPDLIPDYAQRLAAEMGLPFHAVLQKTEQRPQQKTMANSVQQALNVDGSLGVSSSKIPSGPVLLVDDMVDSRWTLTVCAWLLRKNGSGEVWPMALSLTGRNM